MRTEAEGYQEIFGIERRRKGGRGGGNIEPMIRSYGFLRLSGLLELDERN